MKCAKAGTACERGRLRLVGRSVRAGSFTTYSIAAGKGMGAGHVQAMARLASTDDKEGCAGVHAA